MPNSRGGGGAPEASKEAAGARLSGLFAETLKNRTNPALAIGVKPLEAPTFRDLNHSYPPFPRTSDRSSDLGFFFCRASRLDTLERLARRTCPAERKPETC